MFLQEEVCTYHYIKKKNTPKTAHSIPVTHSPHTICAQRIEAARHSASEKMNKGQDHGHVAPPTSTQS